MWEGRYHASLVQGERYLLTCHRYIELNPVRASLTDDPSEYRWSSYHHNALGQPDKRNELPRGKTAGYQNNFNSEFFSRLTLILDIPFYHCPIATAR